MNILDFLSRKTKSIINTYLPLYTEPSDAPVTKLNINMYPSKMSSNDGDLQKKFENIKIDDKFINILLLGPTGVGKSTFINSIANYLTFDGLKTAESENLMCLIPSCFKVNDKHNTLHDVTIGIKDVNEYLDLGVSATQDVKSYVFPIWNGDTRVRLIDTPGIGDTRGVQQDDKNSENILGYIGQLHHLHAICFLLKPYETRSTVYFEYCMSQILFRLDKSASKNIIFIFTNTRGSDYSPGQTLSILKKIVDKIKQQPPYVEIPMNRNIFCFENETFRYLAAIKQNLEFEKSYKGTMSESWKKSSEECWKMIKYIVGDINNPPLTPHFVKSTNAVNEARRMITHLSKPLAEISQLINQNMYILQRHKESIDTNCDTIEELKRKLYMPVVDLDVIKLTQPATVCTSLKCAEIYRVGGKNNWHYKQRCHDPCHLQNVPKEIIGCPDLVNCAAMSDRNCTKCSCSYSIHMHIYYMTKTREDRIIDPNIQQNISSKEKILDNVGELIKNIYDKKKELDYEHKVIINCCAKFAHFLQNNAITPFSDSYKEYIEYLITREKSLGNVCDKNTVDHLTSMLQQYQERKQSFDDALKMKDASNSQLGVTPKQINDSIQELYRLKYNGKKIKELYECQKKSRSNEHAKSEYIHSMPQKRSKATHDQKKMKNKDPDNTKYERQRSSQSRSNSPPPPYVDKRYNQRQPYLPPEHERYQPPRGSYQPPRGSYQPPRGSYHPPPGAYNPPPPDAYNLPPPGGYNPPPHSHSEYYPTPSGPYSHNAAPYDRRSYDYDHADTRRDGQPTHVISINLNDTDRPRTSPNNYRPANYPPAHAYPPAQGTAYPPHDSAYLPSSGPGYPPYYTHGYPSHPLNYHSDPGAYGPPPRVPYDAPYDRHRGVNRQHDGQYENNSRKGNNYRHHGERGHRGRGGVKKNYKNPRYRGNQSDSGDES